MNTRFVENSEEYSIPVPWKANALAAAEALISQYVLPYNIEINLVDIKGNMVDTTEVSVGAATIAGVFEMIEEPLLSNDIDVLMKFVRERRHYIYGWREVPNYGAIKLSKSIEYQRDLVACKVCRHYFTKVHYYNGEEEFVGELSQEGAINAFRNFPWEEQLKEQQARVMTSSSPTVTFKREESRALKIWMQAGDRFEVYYENKYEQAYGSIPLDIDKNYEGTSVEDLINLFFNGSIEKEVLLEFKEELDSPVLHDEERELKFEYHGAEPYMHFGIVLFGVFVFAVLVVIMFAAQKVFWFMLVIGALPLIVSLPDALIKNSLWRVNRNSSLVMNIPDKTFEFTNSSGKKRFSRTDIELCEFFISPSRKENFLRLYLTDGSCVIITSLLVSGGYLVNEMGLHYVLKKVMFLIARR